MTSTSCSPTLWVGLFTQSQWDAEGARTVQSLLNTGCGVAVWRAYPSWFGGQVLYAVTYDTAPESFVAQSVYGPPSNPPTVQRIAVYRPGQVASSVSGATPVTPAASSTISPSSGAGTPAVASTVSSSSGGGATSATAATSSPSAQPSSPATPRRGTTTAPTAGVPWWVWVAGGIAVLWWLSRH